MGWEWVTLARTGGEPDVTALKSMLLLYNFAVHGLRPANNGRGLNKTQKYVPEY